MTGIGTRLKRERVRLKLSQSALGAIGGVETNAQGNYENGLRSPRADYLSRISEAGVDIHFVLTGEEKPHDGPATVAVPLEDLNKVIAGLHASLHDMTQHLYQMTRLLEMHQSINDSPDKPHIDTVRSDAEAISLAAVRLIYVTSKLG